MIRDRIVFGCLNPKVREKLINVGEKLTMDKAIQVVQTFEYCLPRTAEFDVRVRWEQCRCRQQAFEQLQKTVRRFQTGTNGYT